MPALPELEDRDRKQGTLVHHEKLSETVSHNQK